MMITLLILPSPLSFFSPHLPPPPHRRMRPTTHLLPLLPRSIQQPHHLHRLPHPRTHPAFFGPKNRASSSPCPFVVHSNHRKYDRYVRVNQAWYVMFVGGFFEYVDRYFHINMASARLYNLSFRTLTTHPNPPLNPLTPPLSPLPSPSSRHL